MRARDGHAEVLARSLAAARRDLPGLAVDDPGDPATALLDAWATVADVAGFYRATIAAEGVLRTATERRSLLELGRSVGYELFPGLSASTLLAFTVDSPDAVLVPAGTAVQSVPGQDESPQTFETSDDLIGYADRNAIPLRQHTPQRPGRGTTRIRLTGPAHGLRPGDPVLAVGDGGAPETRTLREVASSATETLVTLDASLSRRAVALHTLPVRTAVFGHHAPDWRLIPDAARSASGDDGTGDWPGFPLDGDTLELDGNHPQIVPGGWLLLRGPDTEALFTVLDAAPGNAAGFGLAGPVTRVRLQGATALSGFDRRTAVVHAGSAPLTLADEPVTAPTAGPVLLLDRPVRLDAGAPVLVTGGDVAAAATVAEAVPAEGGTLLTLTAPLPEPIDPATLVVLGNVVAATHGETAAEVLGSGDGTPGQHFRLRRPHLTQLSAPVPGGVRAALEVRVGGAAWQPRPSLEELGPHERGYTVRIGDDGTATVLFGVGGHGARPPSGTENVAARYRTGVGPDGNVRAGTLTLLPLRPLGIRAVTNPMPATGGTAPDTVADARRAVPRATRAPDRVVSLADHELFARSFAGIAKAAATVLRTGTAPYVHLTVTGPGGDDVPAGTLDALRDALTAAGRSGPPMVLRNGRRTVVTIGAGVLMAPGHDLTPVAATIAAAYGFDRREFGTPLTAAEVTALIHTVPGVVSVRLTALHPAGGPPAVAQVLSAAPARARTAAELLVVAPDAITVTEMPA
ncbi:putative baseplate assembly protein [Catenuloplanes japonicus]|uniref:putative baseplate assembly protein n=1 Tax=Catenuloplanes japonicus TaxID=33876 RepID=UPI00068D6743|nr:putative baseplate assembly protein [Catenuloplanes japonicus]